MRLDYARLAAAGLLVAGATGAGAWWFGKPFLTSAHAEPVVPVLGALPLASATLFDLGVYLAVVGTTMLTLVSLASASGDAGEPLSVELLVAGAIGLLTACGIYLMLRGRTFPVVLGLMLLSYAVNLFIFAMGRLAVGVPPDRRRRGAPAMPTRCRRRSSSPRS